MSTQFLNCSRKYNNGFGKYLGSGQWQYPTICTQLMSQSLSQVIESNHRKTQQPQNSKIRVVYLQASTPEHRNLPSTVPPPLNKYRPFLNRTQLNSPAPDKIGASIRSKIQTSQSNLSKNSVKLNIHSTRESEHERSKHRLPKFDSQQCGVREQNRDGISKAIQDVKLSQPSSPSKRTIPQIKASPIDVLLCQANKNLSTTSIEERLIEKPNYLMAPKQSFKYTTSAIFVGESSKITSHSSVKSNLFERLSAYRKKQQAPQSYMKEESQNSSKGGLKRTDSMYSYGVVSQAGRQFINQCSRLDTPKQEFQTPLKGCEHSANQFAEETVSSHMKISQKFEKAMRKSSCSPVKDVYESEVAHFNTEADNIMQQKIGVIQQKLQHGNFQQQNPNNPEKSKINGLQFPDIQSSQQTNETPVQSSEPEDLKFAKQVEPIPFPVYNRVNTSELYRTPTFGVKMEQFPSFKQLPSKIAIPPSIPRCDSQPLISIRKAPGLRKKIFIGIRPNSIGLVPHRYFRVNDSCTFDFLKDHPRSASVPHDKFRARVEVPQAIIKQWKQIKRV